jgi:plastocyanin
LRWNICLARWQYQLLLLLMLMSAPALAIDIQVAVRDSRGQPVPAVVVTLDGMRADAADSEPRTQNMIMDQVKMQFVPEVLVVPVGASVAFPNSDSISHQVYSFSAAKHFQLPLYKGSSNPPVLFDKPGLVVLGCNIHDMMVGYIYVTAAPWYGLTDAQGQLTLHAVHAGTINATIWSPYLTDSADALTKTLQVDAAADTQELIFKLRKPTRGSPQPRPRSTAWDY